MRIEPVLPTAAPSLPGVTGHAAEPLLEPSPWHLPDRFTPSDDDPHEALHQPAPLHVAAPRQPSGPRDLRLITARAWDPVRVRPFTTDDPVLGEAMRHLGSPYRWGGCDPARGVDCSGFVYGVYRRSGRPVPLAWFRDTSVDARSRPLSLQRHGMRHVRTPQPGDVVVFGRQHVGIYAGTVSGQALYVGANHGGPRRAGRVDIMPVSSVGVRPVYYRYVPRKMRATSPGTRW